MSKPSLGFLSRKPQSAAPPKASRTRPLTALAIPIGIGVGILLLLLALFGERLMPAQSVQIETVVTLSSSEQTLPVDLPSNPQPQAASFEGTVLFQASGWIEAYPQSVTASTLVAGVIDEVFVLEGENIKKGTVIATLIDDDARLDLQTAVAKLAMTEARLAASEQEEISHQARQKRLDQQLLAAQARLTYLEEEARSRSELGKSAVSELKILESQQAAISQRANVAALEAQILEAAAEAARLVQITQQLTAERSLAKTERDRRQLALDRTQIRAPISGRIKDLDVVPGQQRMLGPDNPESAAIAHLYDPAHLQARIDVPLAEAAGLSIGQPVRLRSNFLPDQVFRAQVIRIDGEADLQRNTLQAKVKLLDNDDRLRPDMLCRAEFLATNGAANTSISASTPSRVRVFAPDTALLSATSNTASAWVIDASGKRIEKRTLQLGDERRDGYTLIKAGLRPGDKVVLNPPDDMQEGQRVRPSEGKN